MRFNTDKLNSKIQLDELEIQLHLGVSEEERAKTQSVWISLTFEFFALPESTSSDMISGTVNYSSLSKLLKMNSTEAILRPLNTWVSGHLI